MMRVSRHVAFALFLLWASASPSLANIAVIETAAPLSENSNEGISTAVESAVKTAVQGALAMGLSHIALNAVRVLPDAVVIQIIARDTEPAKERGSSPDGTESGQERESDLIL